MALDLSLDRGSRVPLYFQLAQQLEDAIRDGRLRPGDRIDTETDLAERLGLGRPTVRQAVQELVSKGLLVRRRGVGTQVVAAQFSRPLELTSLFDDLAAADHRPSTRVLALRQTPAEAQVATALSIPRGSMVTYIERLRLQQDEPLAIMRNWIPARPAGPGRGPALVDRAVRAAAAIRGSPAHRRPAHRGSGRDPGRGAPARR